MTNLTHAMRAVEEAIMDNKPLSSSEPKTNAVNPRPLAPQPMKTPHDIVAERGKTHGEFTDHARITQSLKRAMQVEFGWQGLTDIQRESLEMIAHKIGRILAGNPNHQDHWDDIAGYAVLVSQRVKD